MSRVLKADLVRKVDYFNKSYKLTNKTNVKFFLSQAYGGYKLVLRSNRGGRHYELPYNYGHVSARECFDKMNRLTRTELNRAVKRARESESYYKKRY